MKLKRLMSKFVHITYTCDQCGYTEKLSKVECAHCHNKGRVYLDQTKKYPVICECCRDKGLYITCSKCHQHVYHKALKYDLLQLGVFFIVAVTFVSGATFIFTN